MSISEKGLLGRRNAAVDAAERAAEGGPSTPLPRLLILLSFGMLHCRGLRLHYVYMSYETFHHFNLGLVRLCAEVPCD